MDSLGSQVYGFAATIAAGLSLGLLFDLYRLWRRTTRPHRVVTAVSDLLFWVVATPLVYLYLVVGNWADLRCYVCIGLSLGLLLYFGVFSLLVRHLLITCGHWVIVVVGALFQGFWLVGSLPWEGLLRGRSYRRRRPGRTRNGGGLSWLRVDHRWAGPGFRPWARISSLWK